MANKGANKGNPFKGLKKITKGFIIDEVTKEVLKFQYNPEQLSISKTPQWASIAIPGMSNPKYQFAGGGDKKISFTLDFYIDHKMSKKHIAQALDFLESLTYPDYGKDRGTNFLRGAHPVLFTFGQYIVNFRGFLSNYTATPQYLFDPVTLLPYRAQVEIELTELLYEGNGKKATYRSNTYQTVRKTHGGLGKK